MLNRINGYNILGITSLKSHNRKGCPLSFPSTAFVVLINFIL